MLITKVSSISGKTNSMEIPITHEQLLDCSNRSRQGEKIQNILPQLNADQREFLMTGITPEEWKEIFG